MVFSDSDPTVVWGSAGGQIWRSTNSGDKWSLIASHDAKGFRQRNGKGMFGKHLANEHCGSTKQRWQCQCSISGRLPTVEQPGHGRIRSISESRCALTGHLTMAPMRKFLTSDGTGNYYLYDYNSTITAGGGLFKSSDGGATFTFVSAATTADKHPISYYSANICSVFAVMPGFTRTLCSMLRARIQSKGYAPTPLKSIF